MSTDYSYLGSGKVYLEEVGGSAGLLEVGNCSALNFVVNEETKELRDYTQPGGGTYNEVRRISSVEMQLTAHDLSPSNLARVLYGSTNALSVTAVTNEAASVLTGKGHFIATAKPSIAITAVTSTGGGTTYTAGTDYEVRPGGIFIPTTSTIPVGAIEIDYTPFAGSMVEAIVNSGKEYRMLFGGLNEARSGKATIIEVYRGRIGAARNLSFIGDEYAALEVTGKVLKDTSKVGGISQYFRVAIAS
jgi:hypothetical protein